MSSRSGVWAKPQPKPNLEQLLATVQKRFVFVLARLLLFDARVGFRVRVRSST